ncbi:MAG: cystathionine beta-synthase [Deltaproteobacteria bacterium]
MQVYENIQKVIGNTPLVRINQIAGQIPGGIKSSIYAKMESLNPGGSVKDRIGQFIIDDAEKRGLLKPGGTLVEATSGNTGFGLAIAAAIRGYKTIFVMPDKMSQEKIQNLRAFGAKVIITPTDVDPEDPRSYYCVSKRISEETPNAFYANQYHNPQNPQSHYETTGPEIWRQTDGKIEAFVCGIGTGGTISGIGKLLKEKNPKVKIVGVDPVGSVYYDYFKHKKVIQPSSYKIEGIGEDFFPTTMDFKYVDEVIQVSDKESLLMTRKLLTREGIFVGGSSGAAMCGAIKYAQGLKKPEIIVVLFPDSGDRYLSKVFNDDWMRENGFLENPMEYGTAQDILRLKAEPEKIIVADKQSKMIDIIREMREYGVSQIPVMDGKKLMGIVSEAELLRYLLDKTHKAQDSIEPIISKFYYQASLDDSLDTISKKIEENKNVIVFEGGKIRGIITKIDLLTYYSKTLR